MMKGMFTVELAAKINQARVIYNETLMTQGASHPSTQSALIKYRRLRRDGESLFAGPDSVYN